MSKLSEADKRACYKVTFVYWLLGSVPMGLMIAAPRGFCGEMSVRAQTIAAYCVIAFATPYLLLSWLERREIRRCWKERREKPCKFSVYSSRFFGLIGVAFVWAGLSWLPTRGLLPDEVWYIGFSLILYGAVYSLCFSTESDSHQDFTLLYMREQADNKDGSSGSGGLRKRLSTLWHALRPAKQPSEGRRFDDWPGKRLKRAATA